MKKNYMGKRLLALTLSTAMVMNCGISVFAEETQSETEIVVSIPEPEKTIDSSEDYSIDDDGNTIITTTTITKGQDESSSYYEDESSSALIDVKGDLIEESGVVKGNQTYEGEVEADITIKFEDMKEGETVSNSSEERETVIGDLKEDETDKKYDQTTIIETPKEVEGTLEKVDITLGNGDVEYSDDIEIGVESLKPTWEEKEDMNVWDADFGPVGTAPDGYDYYYSGYTADSVFGVKVLDKDGNVLDYGDVVQFELTNPETGDIHTAYCADLNTGTRDGWWYTMENAEDAEYYSDEAAGHIKAIAANGYWGTSEGTGSLTQLKDTLKDVLKNNPEALGLTEEQINNMTPGEAQTATQMAIWMFGNHFEGQEVTFVASNYNGGGYGEKTDPENLNSKEVINAVAKYLANLQPADDETEILSTDKFISNVGLVVGNKVEEHANNADEDDTNDAYNVDMTFALAVTVTENDDLIVKVVDGEGNVVRTVRLAGDDSTTNYGTIKPDANGNYVIKGLQLVEGANAFNMKLEGAQYLKQGVYIYTSQVKNSNTSQTFVGMAEGYQTVDLNANVAFNFNVNDGTKTISRIWADEWYEYNEPETDPETEPETETEIETETEAKAEPETETETDPETEIETEIETSQPSYSYRDPVDGDLVEIEDEEVPLADAPETGSIAAACLAVAAVSGLGFTALTLKGKKEDEE